MNFDQAITCHVAWKQKLSRYIAKPDQTLKSTEIASDHNCDLGKWIYGEGARFSNLPEFASLKSEHAHFHAAAASVVARADRGQQVSEELALGARSDFAQASNSVVSSLMALKRKV
jgi:methyl-accepting chemotaxis protein